MQNLESNGGDFKVNLLSKPEQVHVNKDRRENDNEVFEPRHEQSEDGTNLMQ